AAVAADGDLRASVLLVAQSERRTAAAHRTQGVDDPAEADRCTLGERCEQVPRRLVTCGLGRRYRRGVRRSLVAEPQDRLRERLRAELAADIAPLGVRHRRDGLELCDDVAVRIGERDPSLPYVLLCRRLHRLAPVEIGVE